MGVEDDLLCHPIHLVNDDDNNNNVDLIQCF